MRSSIKPRHHRKALATWAAVFAAAAPSLAGAQSLAELYEAARSFDGIY